MLREILDENRSLRLRLLPALIMVFVLIFTSCTSKPRHYSILDFKGKGMVINFSKSPILIEYESDTVNSTAFLANKGDIIMYGDYNFFYYQDTSENEYLFKIIDKTGYLNGKINSVKIPGNDDMIPWFKQMKSNEIAPLDFLYFETPVPESYFTYLTDLAKSKPAIGLGYDGELKDMSGLFEIFNPAYIIGGTISQNEFNLLSGLTNLELLMVSLADSVFSIPLPAMPRLKQLFLSDINSSLKLNEDLLANNRQIEKLLIKKTGKLDLSLIKPLNNLKELIISDFDTVENADLVKNHKQLEVLAITGKKFKYNSGLNELADIRWITFSQDATQDDFSSFLKYHPDIEVVEIIDNYSINDLQPLLTLKKFYGLTISDTLTDFATIKSLKNLKYLSLPDVVLNDSTKKAELLKSLPNSRIVANQGFCLGSGWLLIIIPFILFFRILSHFKPGNSHNRI